MEEVDVANESAKCQSQLIKYCRKCQRVPLNPTRPSRDQAMSHSRLFSPTWPSLSSFQLPSFNHFITSVLNSQISPKIPKLACAPWENSSPVSWENSIPFLWNDFLDKLVQIRTMMWSRGGGECRNLKLNLPHRFWHLRFSYVCISVSLCVYLSLHLFLYVSLSYF